LSKRPRRWCSAEESFYAEIFINVRPVNAKAGAGKLPVSALFRAGMEQTRIPCQRNDDSATVEEADLKFILGEFY
jgi:hypothetical protein